MAEEKEIFNILKDANGNGEAPDLREEGQAEGDAKSHAILPVKDESGNLQYIPMNDGAIVVTSEGQGNLEQQYDSGTVTSAGSEQLASELNLTPNRVYKKLEITVSSFKDCTWRLEKYVDGGTTPDGAVCPGRLRTGAGQYSVSLSLDNIEFTAGATSPSLRLFVTQRSGTGSDFDACMGVIGYD